MKQEEEENSNKGEAGSMAHRTLSLLITVLRFVEPLLRREGAETPREIGTREAVERERTMGHSSIHVVV